VPTMPSGVHVSTPKEARDHLATRRGMSPKAAEKHIASELTRIVNAKLAGASDAVFDTVDCEIEHVARDRARGALAGIENPPIDFSH
jgi:hypothetical protein